MRSEWGTIFEWKRKNPKTGETEMTGWRARYPNPLDPNVNVSKYFRSNQRLLAEQWLEQEHVIVDRYKKGLGEYLLPKDRKKISELGKMSLKDYIDDYLASERDRHQGRDVREVTKRHHREFARHVIEYFGESKKVADIKEKDVAGMLAYGQRWGQTTVSRVYTFLKAVLRQASTPTDTTPAILSHNPCTQPSPPIPKSKQALIPPATPGQLSKLYEAMPDYTRVSIYLAAACGLRISEICALQVRDVDLENKVLHIRHALARGVGDIGEYHLADTKNAASYASLPLADQLIPLLENHIRRFTDREPGSMLMRARKGGILSPTSLRQQFDNAREAAGRPDLHFHTLRATGITEAVYQGATLKETQAFGRHDDAKISLDHYQRIKAGGETRLVNRVAASLMTPLRDKGTVKAELERLKERMRALEAELDGFHSDDE